ncbi:Uncharacterized protein Y057_8863 [Fusarium fujikuroi]|nr:Uncharacterized protein Y057_8863 [Fusarium fujikuroi]
MDGFFTRKRDRKHVTNTRIIYGITFPDPHSSYERPVITQFHVERGDYIRDPKAYFNNIAAQNGYSMQEIDECWNGNGVHVQLSELFNQQSSHIELGVDHIRHLVESRADGGLAYLWDLCQRDPDLTPSNECGPMLKWLLAPVLARGLESLNQAYTISMVHLVNPERLPEEIPDYSRFAMYYLRALFTTIPISQFAHTTNFEPIQGRNNSTTNVNAHSRLASIHKDLEFFALTYGSPIENWANMSSISSTYYHHVNIQAHHRLQFLYKFSIEDSPLNAKLGSESAITAYGRVFDLEYDDDVGYCVGELGNPRTWSSLFSTITLSHFTLPLKLDRMGSSGIDHDFDSRKPPNTR